MVSAPGRAGIVVAVAAVMAAVLLDRMAPPPAADVSRGSEDAFATGLHLRELPPRERPRRWTSGRTVLVFEHLPHGPATLSVALHGQRSPVLVAANGVVVGTLDPGRTSMDVPLRGVGRRVDVELNVAPFRAGDGRWLGAQLDRVSLVPSQSRWPSASLLLAVAAPALLAYLLALWSGWPVAAAALAATALAALECAALGPCGLVRSRYVTTLALELAAGVLAAAVFARLVGSSRPERRPWAFAAALVAALVQGAAATSPLMVVSDAVLNANKLKAVAAGDLFPTSVTQHAPPFRIPYGVSFYALLVPALRAGAEPVAAVRTGAALAGLLASLGLFAVAVRFRPPAEAALVVVLLVLLPGTFDRYSYGNLSNAFGQAATVLFLAWWAGSARGGAPVGAALVAVAGLAHLSSFIVLVPLCAALALVEWRELRADRARTGALVLGLLLCGLYYAQFAGLVAAQLPRLLEGASGRGAPSGGGGWLRPLLGLRDEWGLPAVGLALAGAWRPLASRFDRAIAASWIAGGLLLLPALLSPLEVRYAYALTAPVAVAAAAGGLWLASRGRAGRVAAWALVAAQAVLGCGRIVDAVLYRYR